MADITYKIKNKGSDYYLASSAYCTCDTASNERAKVAYLQNSSSNTFNGGTIPKGITIYVKFKNSNIVGNPTLNVNNSGAKNIVRYGTTAVSFSAATSWRAGAIVAFTFDGTSWVMNTGIDDNTDTDTINTAGATQQAGTLHIVGAPTRDVSPQTYSSSNVTMHNGCVNTPNLNIGSELLFESGGIITTRDGGMIMGSPNGVINVMGNLATDSVNINGEEAATKKWVVDWINDHYGEALSLTVWLENAVAGDPEVNYFEDVTNVTKSYTYNYVVPYNPNDNNANYLHFSTNANNVTFNCTSTGSGAAFVPYYSDYYCRRLSLNYGEGTLMDQLITVVITADEIEYTLYLRFNSPIYAR